MLYRRADIDETDVFSRLEAVLEFCGVDFHSWCDSYVNEYIPIWLFLQVLFFPL